LQQAEAAQAMKSSGITLIAEELAAQRRRARVRAVGWIVAVTMGLGAIYVSGDVIHL
jgi:heme/copper-type cytochrome/quinol oxidase subunit 3